MNTRMDEEQSRREFLRGAARYVTLGGLVFIGSTLFARNRSSSPETCINLEICNGCRVFKRCELPPAVSKKGVRSGVEPPNNRRGEPYARG